MPSDQRETNGSNIAIIRNQQEILEECMICAVQRREVLFKPCNHVATCGACSVRCKTCLLCKTPIEARVKIEEC